MVADQTFTRGNRALAVSADRGLPIRVVRGNGGEPQHSPPSGFRYDGLFYVQDYWHEPGISGFEVYRYRLARQPATSAVSNPPPQPPPSGNSGQAYASVQRLVRNTAVTAWVKQHHDHCCQICGDRLAAPAGPYAEGAHIRPLGSPHDGPDSADNVICLCPNDHVLFDRGGLLLSDALEILDGASGETLGQLRIKAGHELDAAHVAYHRDTHQEI